MDEIIIISSSENEEVCDTPSKKWQTVLIISDDTDEEAAEEEEDEIYFIPRPKKDILAAMISDEELPRIRRERKHHRRHHHQRQWIKQEPESPVRSAACSDLRDDEPPRIPPLPDLPDLTSWTEKQQKEVLSKENKVAKVKKKRKSVDFYKSKSNEILGELFSVSDSDSCIITSVENKHEHKRKRPETELKTVTPLRQTKSLKQPVSHAMSSMVRSLKRSNHTRHHKTNKRSISLDLPPTKASSPIHLPKRSVSVGVEPADVKDGAFKLLEALTIKEEADKDSDKCIKVEKEKIRFDTTKLPNGKLIECSVKLTRLINMINYDFKKPKVIDEKAEIVDNVSKSERHYLDSLSMVSDKTNNVVKSCDTDSITVDLLSASESNDESHADAGDSESTLPDISDNETRHKTDIFSDLDATLTKSNKYVPVSLKRLLASLSTKTKNLQHNRTDHVNVSRLKEKDGSMKVQKGNFQQNGTDCIDLQEESDDAKTVQKDNIAQHNNTECIGLREGGSDSKKVQDSDINNTCTSIVVDTTKVEGDNKELDFTMKSSDFSDISEGEEEELLKLDNSGIQYSDVSDDDDDEQKVVKDFDEQVSTILDSDQTLSYSLSEFAPKCLHDLQLLSESEYVLGSDEVDGGNAKLDYSLKSDHFSDVSDGEEPIKQKTAENKTQLNSFDSANLVTVVDVQREKGNTAGVNVKSTDKLLDDISDNEPDLGESEVDLPAIDCVTSIGKSSNALLRNEVNSPLSRNDSTSDMPILEKMSLEFLENNMCDIPSLERAVFISGSSSSEDEAPTLQLVSTPNSRKSSSSSPPIHLSSTPKRLSPFSLNEIGNFSANESLSDTLPAITPKKRKRKVKCHRAKSAEAPHIEPKKSSMPSHSIATYQHHNHHHSTLNIQEQTEQLAIYLKDHLVLDEHTNSMVNMPDVCQNMVADQDEDDYINLAHSVFFLDHFTKKYTVPNELFENIINTTLYSSTLKSKHLHEMLSILKTVDASRFCVQWEHVARCMDVIGDPDKSGQQAFQASSHLNLLVHILKKDLFCRDLSDSREIHKSSAYKLLSYDVGNGSKRRDLIGYLKRELHSGSWAGEGAENGKSSDMGDTIGVLQELQELLRLAVDCSSSSVDCANALAGDLMSVYLSLPPHSAHQRPGIWTEGGAARRALLDSMSAPLLRYKLIELLLETQYTDTLPLGGFPESLHAVVQAFFRATPMPSPLISPLCSTVSCDDNNDDIDDDDVASEGVTYSPGDTEELAMLLYYLVHSYLMASKEKSYMALRRRSQCTDAREIRLCDREELLRLPDHVAYLERHLRCLTPELTSAAEDYLAYLTCLADLGEL